MNSGQVVKANRGDSVDGTPQRRPRTCLQTMIVNASEPTGFAELRTLDVRQTLEPDGPPVEHMVYKSRWGD